MRSWTCAIAGLTLCACVGQTTTDVTSVDPSAADLAFVEAVVARDVGRTGPGITDKVAVFAAADGSRIACGEWQAPDGLGTTDRAPFYVRWRGATVLRIHVDDATGFGPAVLGCNQAEAGAVLTSG